MDLPEIDRLVAINRKWNVSTIMLPVVEVAEMSMLIKKLDQALADKDLAMMEQTELAEKLRQINAAYLEAGNQVDEAKIRELVDVVKRYPHETGPADDLVAHFALGVASATQPAQPVAGELPPLPERTETPESGDLVGWLRTYAADSGYSHNDYADVMRHAAEEIERLTAQPVQQPAAVETIGNHKAFELAAKALHQDWTPEKVHRLIEVADAYVLAHAVPVPAAGAEFDREEFIEQVIQSVAELPDRDSPEDQPDMMLVTSVELRSIIESQFEIVDEGEPVPASGVQGDFVIGFPDPEAVFAMFCDREGFPSDGDMDLALRKAFYEGTKLGHPAPSILPDSGRDAALEEAMTILNDLVASIQKHGNYTEESTLSFMHQVMLCISAAQQGSAALAAHPAPSSDAVLTEGDLCAVQYAMRALSAIAERKELVGDLIEPMNDIRSASRRAAAAAERFAPVASKLMNMDIAAHTANGAQAGHQAPFMYAIKGPDGSAYIDENCVSATEEGLYLEVNGLNDSPDAGYSIVPVFLAAAPQKKEG